MANASPNSVVGHIAAYQAATLAAQEAETTEEMEALEAEAAEALAAASNKGNSTDPDVVAAVNALLGIETEAADVEADSEGSGDAL